MVVGDFPIEADLAVLGAGPAGVAAALRSAELGVSTTLIEAGSRPGGTWIGGGALATREICTLARVVQTAHRASKAGVRFGTPAVDLARVRAHLEQEARVASDEIISALDASGVTVIEGTARFEDSRRVIAEGEDGFIRVKFRRAIIATGCRAASHPADPGDNPRISCGAGLLALAQVPESLLVIGGGSSAVELAMSWAFLGSTVTLATSRPRILGSFDEALRTPVIEALESALEGVHTGATVKAIDNCEDGVLARFDGPGPSNAVFQHVLLGAQRAADLESLGISATQVHLDSDGFAIVDSGMRTSDSRILAAGDCTGLPHIATRAIMQGRVAAEVVAGWQSAYDIRAVPTTIHMDPQIAACGFDEGGLRDADIPFGVETTTSGHGSARTLTRILYDPDTRLILGVGIVGPHACEAIGEGVLAIEMGAVADDLAATLHPRSSSGATLGDAARRIVK